MAHTQYTHLLSTSVTQSELLECSEKSETHTNTHTQKRLSLRLLLCWVSKTLQTQLCVYFRVCMWMCVCVCGGVSCLISCKKPQQAGGFVFPFPFFLTPPADVATLRNLFFSNSNLPVLVSAYFWLVLHHRIAIITARAFTPIIFNLSRWPPMKWLLFRSYYLVGSWLLEFAQLLQFMGLAGQRDILMWPLLASQPVITQR